MDAWHTAHLVTLGLLVELPVLAAVLTTGAVLLSRSWPPSPLLWVKIVAGLGAVTANLWCVMHVVVRRRRLEDLVELRRQGRGSA